MGNLILAEILQGLRKDYDYQLARHELIHLPFADMIGREIALFSASNFTKLRKQGIIVRKSIDILIATFCLQNDHTILHDDRDNDAMVELIGLGNLHLN